VLDFANTHPIVASGFWPLGTATASEALPIQMDAPHLFFYSEIWIPCCWSVENGLLYKVDENFAISVLFHEPTFR